MSELQKVPVRQPLPQRRSAEPARTTPLGYPITTTYRESELAASLTCDALFFLRHRDRFHRVRKATPAEVRCVQVLEHRMLKPTEGTVPIVLVQRVDDSHRRRVIIEAHGLDLDAIDEAEAASLFEDVTRRGWTWV